MKINKKLWNPFKQYLYIDRKLSDTPHSISTDKSRFNKLTTYFSHKDFNRDTFNTFIAYLKAQNYSASYINNVIKLAKHLDRWLKVGQLQDYTYFKERKRLKMDVLSPVEIEKLAMVQIPYKKNANYINQRNKALILLLGTTGCRIGEALNLTFDDLYSTPPHAILRDTKNGEDRLIILWQYVYDLITALPRLNDYVFPSARKGKLEHQQVNFDLKARAKAIGLTKPVWCHLMRHSYITTMIESGADWFRLAPLVGHKDPKTTQRYVSNNLSHQTEIAQMHPLLKKSLSWEEKVRKVKQVIDHIFEDDQNSLNISEEKGKIEIRIEDYGNTQPTPTNSLCNTLTAGSLASNGATQSREKD